MTGLRDLLGAESGQHRADYTLLVVGGLALLVFVLILAGVDMSDLLRLVDKLEYMLFRR
jgi:hypothetical protein